MRLALAVLAAVHLAALGAGFLAPYPPTEQNRMLPYAPPTRLHFVDTAGRLLLAEMYRDYIKEAYVKEVQRYLPELQAADLLPGPSGVRAQALSASGKLVDDFLIQRGENIVHVQNAPSPAATSSLVIARMIVDEAWHSFDLAKQEKV